MSGVYSGKFSQRQCKIQLSRENLGEQNVLESAFFRVFLKSKFRLPVLPLDILGLLQTSSFELLEG